MMKKPKQMSDEPNPRAVVGGNQPLPYEESKKEIDDLFLEASNWCDGEPVTDQEQADAIQALIRKIQKAADLADERRKVEKKPFDDGATEVQGRYNPLIQRGKGRCDLAVAACKKALHPFLLAEKKRIDDEAEKRRQEAIEADRKAREALAAARQTNDLASRENAERLITEAKTIERVASRAEATKPMAKAAGGGRAIGLRTKRVARIANARSFLAWAWANCPQEVDTFLAKLAQDMVDQRRQAAGVEVDEVEIV